MTLHEFVEVYEEYLVTNDQALKPKLLEWLRDFEEIKTTMLPVNGYGKVIAWEVLTSHTFYFERSNAPFEIYEGELIIQQKDWDRDVFFTRYPRLELVSGRILAMEVPEERIFLPIYDPHVIKNKVITLSQKITTQMLDFVSTEEKEVWQKFKLKV